MKTVILDNCVISLVVIDIVHSQPVSLLYKYNITPAGKFSRGENFFKKNFITGKIKAASRHRSR